MCVGRPRRRPQRRAAEMVHGRVRTGGLVASTRVPGTAFAGLPHHGVQQARTVLDPFPRDGTVPSRAGRCGSKATMARSSRAAPGRSGLLNIRWDPLIPVYFLPVTRCGNYLTTPYLLTREGVAVEEERPGSSEGETWRRLIVSFPCRMYRHPLAFARPFTSMPAVSCAATTMSRRSLVTGHGAVIIAPTLMSTGLYSRLAGGSTRSARGIAHRPSQLWYRLVDRHPGSRPIRFAGSRRTSQLLKPLAYVSSHHRGWR